MATVQEAVNSGLTGPSSVGQGQRNIKKEEEKMGLDFSHGGAHWGYGGFMRFRRRLAAEIGISLLNMEGFVDGGISWSAVKDPIGALLSHSDCDGTMTPSVCRKVAKRLREMIADWPSDDYDKIQGLLLAEGMELAAEQHKRLKFM